MKIALVGNQNSGKTTLFNELTGTNQKVGNWPGVTIERKEGKIKGTDLTVVDLPGIYSLSPYTSEEEISRKFAMEEKPDLIINIVDSTCIERSLYLTTQLLELDSKVIVALNMTDLLEKKGITLDEKKLGDLLGTTVVKISALKKTGINELIDVIKEDKVKENKHQKIFDKDIEKLIDEVGFEGVNRRFVAVKALEQDPNYKILLDEKVRGDIEKIEAYNNSMKIISVANHKGGVGKTTSVLNLGAGLSRMGQRVLLIDLDPQRNLSQGLGFKDSDRTIYEALSGKSRFTPVDVSENLSVVPSS